MAKRKVKSDTLCWTCAKATTNECSYSDELKPVEGWIASKTNTGYCVKECPLYELGIELEPYELHEKGMQELGYHVMKEAGRDYQKICKGLSNKEKIICEMANDRHYVEYLLEKKEYEAKFFNSQYAQIFTDLDPQYIREAIEKKCCVDEKLYAYIDGAEDIHEYMRNEFVRITHCKDCKHWHKYKLIGEFGYCDSRTTNTYPEEYCNKGEKR